MDKDELPEIQCALRLEYSRAKDWGIDTAPIGVMGFPAGDELAALFAMWFDYGKINATDPIDRSSSRPAFQTLIYPGNSARVEVATNVAPIFLVGGYNDRPDIAEDIAQAYLKYKKAGVWAELHIYSNAGHGSGIRETNHGAVSG